MNHNRKLNSTEQAMELLNRHRGAWNVITISCLQGILTKDVLRQSLDLIQFRHPRLRSQIVGNSLDELYFVESQDRVKIPLQVVWQTKDESWQDIVVSELNQAIDSSQYLMKCFLVYRQSSENSLYLITKIHHAICDGLSAIKLHSEILQNCQNIASKIAVDSVAELPVLPPLEKLWPKWMNGKLGEINELIFVLKLQLKQKLYPLSNLTVEQLVPLEDRSCGAIYKCLPPNITKKLIHICSQEKSSVQGALCAAMLLAVVDRNKKSQIDKVNLICNSYADLRRRMTPQVEQENLAVMASFLMTFHKVDRQTSFWHLARDVYRQNKKGLSRGDVFKPAKSMRKIIEYYLTNCDRVPVSVGVTNVGKVEIPQNYDLFKLESINFVAGNPIFPGSLLAAVTTYQQKMHFNFTFSKPSISQQQAESMVNYSMNLLAKICQSTEEEQAS